MLLGIGARLVVVSGIVLVVACGGSNDRAPNSGAGTGPEVCPPLVGAYVVTSDLIDTNCPGLGLERHNEKLVVMNLGPQAGCRMVDQRATPAQGGCSYEETQVCPKKGLNVTASLSVSVPPDARDIQGMSVIQFEGDGQRCMGRYRVRYLKTAAR
ncbi:MAG: hypothetical protein U0235_24025 [Polyangiaceae bacterium]